MNSLEMASFFATTAFRLIVAAFVSVFIPTIQEYAPYCVEIGIYFVALAATSTLYHEIGYLSFLMTIGYMILVLFILDFLHEPEDPSDGIFRNMPIREQGMYLGIGLFLMFASLLAFTLISKKDSIDVHIRYNSLDIEITLTEWDM
jgi:hypothetical protein